MFDFKNNYVVNLTAIKLLKPESIGGYSICSFCNDIEIFTKNIRQQLLINIIRCVSQ